MAAMTKKLIRDSFIKLLNEKPFSKITVRDIVDDCGVNRNTFYYYYQDLPQLLESIVDEEADRLIREQNSMGSLEDCIDAVIGFALENRTAVMHIYRSVNRDIYERYQWRVCQHVTAAYVDTALAGRVIPEEDRRVIIDYWKCVCFGLVSGWLETGMQGDIRARFRRIFQLKDSELETMLARCLPEAESRQAPAPGAEACSHPNI